MTPNPTGSAREEILTRIRTALAQAPEAAPIERDYQPAHVETGLTDLLAENLTDYRATVHRTTASDLPATIAALIHSAGTRSIAIPDGLPQAWLARLDPDLTRVPDTAELTARDLDTVETVITACALAIAETGTIVLDAGPGQGRRLLTLVPDHHICIIHGPDQVVASLPHALPRLDPARPQTWISGPSATSDIELDRVEGVHGPRKLDVILVEG